MSLVVPLSTRDGLAARLTEARRNTLRLIQPLSGRDLSIQHDPLLSPIVWDLGHIAHFEELWLTQNLDGEIRFVEMPGLFNPMEHPRSERGNLALPSIDECLALMQSIRERVLERLARTEFRPDHPLLRDGYVYHMVLQHEYQHCETILQTLQLKQGTPYRPVARRHHPVPAEPMSGPGMEGMVVFPGGDVWIGTNDRRAAYDNERPSHPVSLAPFRMDVRPVTNGDFLTFMEAGGYERREWWSAAGWQWQAETRVSSPKYWFRRDGAWWSRVLDQEAPVDRNRPVCHVCYYEAEAYARSVGKRLPTEIEWEAAATWDPRAQVKRDFPWGKDPATPELANIGQVTFETAPVGSYERNVSPIGCYGMIGDVWEWTSSVFHGYPGFEAFPYPEYSKVFFGDDHRVLRGGSWATLGPAIRGTFRNWDYPIRRQIFSGLRCAADA